MTRKSQVLTGMGVVAGIAVLVGVYFLTVPMPEMVDVDLAALIDEQVADLLADRRLMDETVWAQEVEAQKHEQTIVKYWDQMLRPEDDKYAVLAKFPFETITLDEPGETTELDWGIKRTTFGGKWKTFDQEGWREFLRDMQGQGYGIDAIEFHQNEYDVDPDGNATSIFSILLNVANEDMTHLWTLKTKLRIEWTGEKDDEGLYVPGDLTLFDTKVLEREGAPVFEHRVLQAEIHEWSYPLVHDLNRDGLSDILLPTHNMAMWNRGGGEFEDQALFLAPGVDPPETIYAAVVADFTGDGHLDLLCAGFYKSTYSTDSSPKRSGLYLFRGDATGHFVAPGEQVGPRSLSLSSKVMSLTAGDVDADGDLDLWLSQYKGPYTSGQMPTPFHDANDGYPSYLLLNQGDGVFDDATKAAGLATKRYRRTYAASFVDLDDDNDLDLLVSSDFSGTDLYFNDGTGHFSDETSALLEETSNFGMGHTFADFNQDGALDFYVIGMGSTTMRRLNKMGLYRPDRPDYVEMRTKMGYGNRMYLAREGGSFRQPEYNDAVSRSGWSWGATSFDFDSDGDMDVYVANGFMSGETTKDYCTRYWCHDIYLGSSQPDPAIETMLAATYAPHLQNDLSWDGYQKNHLFMNESGKGFVNVAFLVNTALGDDARGVVSDDFDGDGRPDLLVTSRQRDWAGNNNRAWDTLHLLVNRWPIENNWIGVRLQIEAGGPSTIGAVIRVRSSAGEQFAHIVTGDSFRAQHAPMKHFGLGPDGTVDAIEIQWPDGTKEVIENPAINTYHVISSSTAS